MPGKKISISAKQAAKDIHAGISHDELMAKYGLSETQMQQLYSRLAQMGMIDSVRHQSRIRKPSSKGQPVPQDTLISPKSESVGDKFSANLDDKVSAESLASAFSKRRSVESFKQFAPYLLLIALAFLWNAAGAFLLLLVYLVVRYGIIREAVLVARGLQPSGFSATTSKKLGDHVRSFMVGQCVDVTRGAKSLISRMRKSSPNHLPENAKAEVKCILTIILALFALVITFISPQTEQAGEQEVPKQVSEAVQTPSQVSSKKDVPLSSQNDQLFSSDCKTLKAYMDKGKSVIESASGSHREKLLTDLHEKYGKMLDNSSSDAAQAASYYLMLLDQHQDYEIGLLLEHALEYRKEAITACGKH